MHETGGADALEIEVAGEVVASRPQRLQRRIELRLRLDIGAGRRRHAAADRKPDALRLVDDAVALDAIEPQHEAVGLQAFVAQLDEARNRDAVSGKAEDRMLDQRRLDRRNGKARRHREKAERENEGERPAPQEDRGNCGNRSRRQRRPPSRFVIGREVENDAGAECDREPGKEAASANLGGGPGAHARWYGETDIGPNALPAPLRTANRPGSDTDASAIAHASLRRTK
jgi:hypothetical protein